MSCHIVLCGMPSAAYIVAARLSGVCRSAIMRAIIGIDALTGRTGLTVAELSSMMLVMELQGLVAAEHGRYTRKA